MPIRKTLHVAFEQVQRSESFHIKLSDNLKNGQQKMIELNKTNDLQEGNVLTPKPKPESESKLESKPKPKAKPKPKPKSILKKHSSLKSHSNPLTISRKTKIKKGEPLKVHFDDKVIIHKVSYWDPSGDTFPSYGIGHVEYVPATFGKKNNKFKKYFFCSKNKSKKIKKEN
eukprot:963819_1